MPISRIAVLASSLVLLPQLLFSEEVRLATWPEYGKNAGIVYAEFSGLYEKHGLSTVLIDSFQNGLFLLEAGEADIAQVFCSAALTQINKGLNAKIIAVRDQENPVATVSLEGSGISNPADYTGKTWGHSPGFSPEKVMLSNLMMKHSSSISQINLINLEFPARLPALLAGEVDFVSAWVGSGLPAVIVAARKAGSNLDVVLWEKLGVDVYGECYVARLQPDGELPLWLESWLAATKEGHLRSLAEPQEVFEAVAALGPKVGDKETLDIALQQGNDLLLSSGMSEKDILSIDLEKMISTARWANISEEQVSKAIDVRAIVKR